MHFDSVAAAALARRGMGSSSLQSPTLRGNGALRKPASHTSASSGVLVRVTKKTIQSEKRPATDEDDDADESEPDSPSLLDKRVNCPATLRCSLRERLEH